MGLTTPSHGSEPASAWIASWAHLVPAGGQVLDVACGLGRHTRFFLERNNPVTAVDIAQAAIENIAKTLPPEQFNQAELTTADIENGPWPFADRQFAGIVVTNYLHRPLLPILVQSLAPGGVLLYETFAAGNETVGKPSRPDFLLHPGELLNACASLRVIAYEDGFTTAPDRFVQRIAAVRELLSVQNHQKPVNTASIPPARYPLSPA